ncbi:hypothetical protein SLE2022_221590 [Rubroshorea leprosula]
MGVSFKYWDDCVDPKDMEAMWKEPEVRTEWIDAGETQGQKVHLSRDPDGQPYLTQIEMKAVADIVIHRHFDSKLDPEMICAIAELESDRQPLAIRYEKKIKDTTIGIMQLLPKTAEWLSGEHGYQSYQVQGIPDLLFRPFVSVYFGAAYLEWLSNFEGKERSEEFVVRAYKGGTKQATHKSTLPYWKRYLSVKESLPYRKICDRPSPSKAPKSPTSPCSPRSGSYVYWDSRVSPEDMEEMSNHPAMSKGWAPFKEKREKMRFALDGEKRPYLSRAELKAIAEIIVSKYFSTRGIKPVVLCALAEMVSRRILDGDGSRPGLMGIDYSTAFWLYMEVGYRAYRVDYVEDLTKPFVSMYFGAAYYAWLSEYEGRERTPQFVVQAYFAGPKKVNLQETGPLWLNFEQALSNFEERSRDQESCSIL